MRRIFADYTTGGLSLRRIALGLNAEASPRQGRALDHLDAGAHAEAGGLRGAGVGEHRRDGRRPGPRPTAPPGPSAPQRVDHRALPPHRRRCHLRGGGGRGPDNTNFSARRLDPDEQGWLLRGLVFCACGRAPSSTGATAPPPPGSLCACRDRCGPTTEERRCRWAACAPTPWTSSSSARSGPRWHRPRSCWPANGPSPPRPCPRRRAPRRRAGPARASPRQHRRRRRRVADLYRPGSSTPTSSPGGPTRSSSDGAAASRRESLLAQRQEPTVDNRLRRRIDSFADRATAAIDGLDFAQRQRLVRLLVEHVDVRLRALDVQLRIPLDDPEGPGPAARNRRRARPRPRCQPKPVCVALVTVRA